MSISWRSLVLTAAADRQLADAALRCDRSAARRRAVQILGLARDPGTVRIARMLVRATT